MAEPATDIDANDMDAVANSFIVGEQATEEAETQQTLELEDEELEATDEDIDESEAEEDSEEAESEATINLSETSRVVSVCEMLLIVTTSRFVTFACEAVNAVVDKLLTPVMLLVLASRSSPS